MKKHKSRTLTDSELKWMQILWQKGSGTINELINSLPSKSRPAYSTVLTFMRILEQKGYVKHEKRGRAFVYIAVVEKNEERQNVLSSVVKRFFDNSPEQLVLNVLKQERLSSKEISQLKNILKKAKNGGSNE